MLNRRNFIALAAVAALSACAAPLIETTDSNRLNLVEVSVDATKAKRVRGREVSIGLEQVETDVRDAVVAEFAKAAPGTRPVNISIEVTEVLLANPGTAALGVRSKVDSLVTVTDAATGAVILGPVEVDGVGLQDLRAGGIIGAAITAGISPLEDYRETVTRYATTLRRRLLGDTT